MKVTKLNQPELFITKMQDILNAYGIELWDISYPTKSSVKFRASRTFNKPYCGGGMKYGQPIPNPYGFINGNIKQAKHLHWEEWAVINDTLNRVCDAYDLGGSCKSWFDAAPQWVRRNGVQLWQSDLTCNERLNMQFEYQKQGKIA